MPNFHIKRAKLDGYRNIRGTEAEFCDGLNIIIGPNGCGKSNFLWLLDKVVNDYSKLNFEFDAVIDYYVAEADNIQFSFEAHEEQVKNKIEYKHSFETIPELDQEGFDFYNDLMEDAIVLINYNVPSKIECFSEPTDTILVNFNNRTSIKSENTVLQNIFQKNIFQNDTQEDCNFSNNIKIELANYTPIKDIKIKNIITDIKTDKYEDKNHKFTLTTFRTETKYHGLLYEFQTEDGRYYTWNELSDGTRRIVWLVLNILTTDKKIILIEEPELGIHPHQLFKLMEFLKEQSEEKQFIITTHSPEVLNVIESNELDRIKIARYDAERKTMVMENIPEKRQKLIQKHLAKTGQLSDYWVHVNLEGTHKWGE